MLRAAEGEPAWSAAWVTLGDADSLDHLLDDWLAVLRRGGPSDLRFAEPLRHDGCGGPSRQHSGTARE